MLERIPLLVRRSGRGAAGVVAYTEDFGMGDHAVCGAKEGFAENFLMPQPSLLTRRGMRLLKNDICAAAGANIFQRWRACAPFSWLIAAYGNWAWRHSSIGVSFRTNACNEDDKRNCAQCKECVTGHAEPA